MLHSTANPQIYQPENKLSCTVILVAMEGSQNAAHSWAAKMRSGLLLRPAGASRLEMSADG